MRKRRGVVLLLQVMVFAVGLGKHIDTRAAEAEVVFASEEVRPGNLALTPDGRLFVTMNPLLSPNTKVFEIDRLAGNKASSYPNNRYASGAQSIIKSVIGTRVDSQGNLWLLDMQSKQFVVWDTRKNRLHRTIVIPEHVVLPASFLQDFIIDELHSRVIIADMTQGDLKSAPEPAFIVIDLQSGNAKRMAQSHQALMPELEGGFALNPIAIDPNFEYVYFGALHGRTLYRAPAASFADERTLISSIKTFGTKSYSDGIAVDGQENVYVTNVEKSEIGVFNPHSGFNTLASLPEGQSWPDGLYVASDGYLYATVDQLNRTAALNNGKDVSQGPFLVVRTPLLSQSKPSDRGFLVTLKAKPGKALQAEAFLRSALALAMQEPNTLQWYAFKIDDATFGIFDTFASETGRLEHLHGRIAEALFSDTAKALFVGEPKVQKTAVFGVKSKR